MGQRVVMGFLAALSVTQALADELELAPSAALRCHPPAAAQRATSVYLTRWFFHFKRQGDALPGVRDLQPPTAARSVFYDWLSHADLDLSPRQQASALGDYIHLAVPCGKIDLSSPPLPPFKEKTS